MSKLDELRTQMRNATYLPDLKVLENLKASNLVSHADRQAAVTHAAKWVEAIRAGGKTGLMDVFMAEYGLSTDEGIALMCLAEALLRVPDAETMSALIEDKIATSDWSAHLGQSSSPLVNASTWALMLTGRVLNDDRPLAGVLHFAIKRVGEPVIRQAVKRAMRELGAQFVLGQDIKEAIKNGKSARKKGYTFSYDMLGEAAMTAHDAQSFFESYEVAIKALAKECKSEDIRENPGISIKLSALFERYEYAQRDLVMNTLVPRVLKLATFARDAGMGLNIDAEEANRLDLSLDVIEAVVRNPSLGGWDGFGIVVQAYGKRAAYVVDWYHALARELDRKFMLRLVKGAYWDAEIKLAQVENYPDFPVFKTKAATDISYLEIAAKLLCMTDHIYPQFATHNAHTVAMVKIMAKDQSDYEFQRLHGMGDGLYNEVMKEAGANCRIYAPVGVHRDLLAYLVRRLLENGANSSFVNQILDQDVPALEVAADPYLTFENQKARVKHPSEIFSGRLNSKGWNLNDQKDVEAILAARDRFANHHWKASSILVEKTQAISTHKIHNPSTGEEIGLAEFLSADHASQVITSAKIWDADVGARAAILRKAADIYEENFGEIFALLTKEAGKSTRDAIAEIREAVDFIRFYANEAEKTASEAAGVFLCVSPWNFPLAIFTGQVVAALAMGNGVIAKPAETTSIIAHRAVNWLHDAGVPKSALQLTLGLGSEIGADLSAQAGINGICFTGSTATAQRIHRAMADHAPPTSVLIAETGGLNAMIVDSTALPEQAVRDIVMSAFQSAGQRCSALRMLYLQEDVADRVLEMLYGAMDALRVGDPWDLRQDIGPVIDQNAKNAIGAYIEHAAIDKRVLKSIFAPKHGHFIAPTVIKVDGIADLGREIFGPVLHVATFKASELDKIVEDINATGYGLTFGVHSRIDDRVNKVTALVKAGNIYVNRNQIGAVVGSQPFGGEGLSGTGPKAGGPLYLERFAKIITREVKAKSDSKPVVQAMIDQAQVGTQALSKRHCEGPTGESNLWSIHPRGVILCAGPGASAVQVQMKIASAQGCVAIDADGIGIENLDGLHGFVGLVYWGEARAYRQALAKRDGAIIPLISARDFSSWCFVEQHICVDTTAAGGNAKLLAGD